MGEIVNFNKAKKLRDKAAAKVRATENRAVHGRSKAESQQTALENLTRSRALDGHKLDRDPERPDDQ